MAAEWYYRAMDEVRGPFTSAQFRQLAREGVISRLTNVQQGVNGNWVSAQRVNGLFPPSEPIDSAESVATSDGASGEPLPNEDFSEIVDSLLEYAEKSSPAVAQVASLDSIEDAKTLDESSRVAPPRSAVESGVPPRFVYKMIPIPRVIEVDRNTSTREQAAGYLESVVNDYASRGWEFFRVDTVDVWRNPGCLGSIFGMRGESFAYNVITFRRQVK